MVMAVTFFGVAAGTGALVKMEGPKSSGIYQKAEDKGNFTFQHDNDPKPIQINKRMTSPEEN